MTIMYEKNSIGQKWFGYHVLLQKNLHLDIKTSDLNKKLADERISFLGHWRKWAIFKTLFEIT